MQIAVFCRKCGQPLKGVFSLELSSLAIEVTPCENCFLNAPPKPATQPGKPCTCDRCLGVEPTPQQENLQQAAEIAASDPEYLSTLLDLPAPQPGEREYYKFRAIKLTQALNEIVKQPGSDIDKITAKLALRDYSVFAAQVEEVELRRFAKWAWREQLLSTTAGCNCQFKDGCRKCSIYPITLCSKE